MERNDSLAFDCNTVQFQTAWITDAEHVACSLSSTCEMYDSSNLAFTTKKTTHMIL